MHAFPPVTAETPADEWVTRADAAALAGCSEDSIRRDERKHDLTIRHNGTGAVLVRVADLVQIGRIRRGTLTSPVESAEVVRARATITELKVQVAEVSAKLGVVEAMVTSLLGQLEQKDKQIASLTRAHEALVVRVPAVSAR